ncbi:ankyrin repeat domain-containing protein [Parashewanella curva]|uniref:ankyrin repeat domain-containing protein n=1 Tax=Parashewanella curva TaxID=2338552 RepID=UPI00311F39BC
MESENTDSLKFNDLLNIEARPIKNCPKYCINGLSYFNASLFWLPCRTGHIEVFSALLEGKPDLDEQVICTNKVESSKRTPVMIAAIKLHTDIVVTLIEKGADT